MTLKELIEKLLSQITEDDFKKVPKNADAFTAAYHHGFGRHIRNKYDLWSDESFKLKHDIWENMTEAEKTRFNDHWAMFGIAPNTYSGADMHADDASAIIMERLWYAAKEKFKGLHISL